MATALVTGDVCSVNTVRGTDKNEDYHFALSLPHEKVPRAGGGEFHVPKPQGMSGGGIWRLEVDTARGLASSLSLVGIGIEYHKAVQTFVATRIQEAAPLARDLVALKDLIIAE